MTRTRSRQLCLIAASVTVAGVLVVGAGSPGAAATTARNDPRGDGRVAGLDITKTRASYAREALAVTTTFADLGSSGWVEFQYGPSPLRFADPTTLVQIRKAASGKVKVKVRRFQEYTGEGKTLRGCVRKVSWSQRSDQVTVVLKATCGAKRAPRAVDLLGVGVFSAGRAEYSDETKRMTVRR